MICQKVENDPAPADLSQTSRDAPAESIPCIERKPSSSHAVTNPLDTIRMRM